MKVIITGGAGFIGSALARRLLHDHHEVIIYDRISSPITHKNLISIITSLDNATLPPTLHHADAVIHLAGAPVQKRWTKMYEKIIYESRIGTTRALIRCIADMEVKPKIVVSASAIGYYGHTGDDMVHEDHRAGTDFLAQVCHDWEYEARKVTQYGVRWVGVRTSLVLGARGGILQKLIPLFRLGLGARIGTGRQWFPWIHMDDLVEIYVQALHQNDWQGPINAVAPQSIPYNVFAKTLARLFHKPYVFFIPTWILKIFFGNFATTLTYSTRAVPTFLEQHNFQFQHPQIGQALDSIITVPEVS